MGLFGSRGGDMDRVGASLVDNQELSGGGRRRVDVRAIRVSLDFLYPVLLN